jgi:hypothetical protein
MDQLLDAERMARIPRCNSIPGPFEVPLQAESKSSGLSEIEEARYREILAILRYPLDGESLPNESDLKALSEKEQERLERCAILAAWDRFWRRGQVAPDSILR